MISRSDSKLDHLGSKTRSPGLIKEKPCQHSGGHIFEAVIMSLAQNVCLGKLSLKLCHLGQKLGHQAKSKEYLVNTPEVTFFK